MSYNHLNHSSGLSQDNIFKNNNKNQLSVFSSFWMNSNDYRKKQNIFTKRLIKNGICEWSNLHNFKSVFITLTYENDREKNCFSYMNGQFSNKFRLIQQQLKRNNIVNYGLKSVERHKDGVPHIHIQLFCKEEHIPEVFNVFREYFKSPVNTNEKALQIVKDNDNKKVGDYLLKLEIENNEEEEISVVKSSSKVSFFGVRKDIFGVWKSIWKNPIGHDNKIIKDFMKNKNYYSVLVLLNCFQPVEQWLKRVEKPVNKTVKQKKQLSMKVRFHKIEKKVFNSNTGIVKKLKELQTLRNSKKLELDSVLTEKYKLEKITENMISKKEHINIDTRELFLSLNKRLLELSRINFNSLNEIKKLDVEIDKLKSSIEKPTIKIIYKNICEKITVKIVNKSMKSMDDTLLNIYIPRKRRRFNFHCLDPPKNYLERFQKLIFKNIHFARCPMTTIHNTQEKIKIIMNCGGIPP